jgi:hypothetical protein
MDAFFRPGQECWTIFRTGDEPHEILISRPCRWTGEIAGGRPVVREGGLDYPVNPGDLFHTAAGVNFKIHTLDIPLRLDLLRWPGK